MNKYFNSKGTIGFTCDVCGRELNGCQIVNGMTFCAKCYQETFGKDNQQNEIQQLKQQLAEKDKEIAHLKEKDNYHLRYELAGADETITNLKQQLEEKDKEIERLKERLSVFDNFKDNYGYTNYDDSEILEDLQSRAFQAEDDTQVVNELLQFFNIFDENELVDKVKEPQIQLAIQELEKVKEWLEPKYFDYEQINYLSKIINQQIKELKGE